MTCLHKWCLLTELHVLQAANELRATDMVLTTVLTVHRRVSSLTQLSTPSVVAALGMANGRGDVFLPRLACHVGNKWGGLYRLEHTPSAGRRGSRWCRQRLVAMVALMHPHMCLASHISPTVLCAMFSWDGSESLVLLDATGTYLLCRV